uniref:SANT domain-containing protein n=1 Tax=Globisporangium ultimum (strain ATCC 200006 / CBS 805.95 / DAOM BR144) TaxID=431595 RepID=K3WK73_GLOUD
MAEQVRAQYSELEPEEEEEGDEEGASDDARHSSDSSPLKQRVFDGDGGSADIENSVTSASAYWKQGVSAEYQMKRPSAILRMKPNTYGFKASSTFDTLVALTTPLRQRQVLDDWTALEIAIFEASFEKFGRKFHLIADQLPNKTARDVISFFYVWKKHGSCAKYSESDDEFPEPDLPLETSQLIEKLRRRQSCMKAYLSAARSLYAPRFAPRFNHKRVKLSEFGLQGVPALESAINETSVLKSTSVLDSWTPIEIRVFEVSMECYGKDFRRIAQVIETKTCREVIALYYIWKKDLHYQTIKSRWGKSEVYSKKAPERSNSTRAEIID